MGFGSIIGQVFFIFIIVIVVANVLIIERQNTISYNNAKKENNDIIKEMSSSTIKIINLTSYQNKKNDPIQVNITIENTGNIKLVPNNMDVYIDGIKLDRNQLTFQYILDILNPRILDQGERISIINYQGTGGTHMYTVVDEYSSRDQASITIIPK